MTAAMAVRTAKKVSGPASFVPYRATMKPVLHSATKSAGASETAHCGVLGAAEVIPMTVGRARFVTLPSYE